MTKRAIWLSELREWDIDGQPGSGGYRPRKEIIKEIAEACDLPFSPNGEQTKSDWRRAVNAYFDARNEP